MEHYKCLTGLGTDAQNSGRTPGLFLRLKALYSVSSNKETHNDSKDEHWQLQTEAEMEMRYS